MRTDLTIQDLQKSLSCGIPQFVKEEEDRYENQLEVIANEVMARHAKMILLAGPSSSGKTTSSKMLAQKLTEKGYLTQLISLDDFYRSQHEEGYPKTKDGAPDYESPYALDLTYIHDTIAHICQGEPVWLPRFDFHTRTRIANATYLQIPQNGCVIMEGLHALNPLLTEGLTNSSLVKIFVSVSTNIMSGDTRVLSGKKIRFLRRLSRDYLYRNTTARQTLLLWPNVLAGENQYLYPYRDTADFQVNTFHAYEVGVLKYYAERVLNTSDEIHSTYLDAVRLGLSYFDTIRDSYVPETSLIREFIPGGIYEEK